MTNEHAFSVTNIKEFKIKMLNWANRFSIFCMLDSNNYEQTITAGDCMLAAGSKRSTSLGGAGAFKNLQEFYDLQPSWLFGHLGYNAGNTAYGNPCQSPVNFGDGFFFEPEIIIRIDNSQPVILNENKAFAEKIFEEISLCKLQTQARLKQVKTFVTSLQKEEYLLKIKKLQEHIQQGECYEINFCMSFLGYDAVIDPLLAYAKLAEISPNPFSALYKLEDKYCICASPERFLKKTGNTVISQPIKGTIRRNTTNLQMDLQQKNTLKTSEKEKAENVMVVDLVRNDLSKIAMPGSVTVKELFGLYSFPQVHHLISTIECSVKKNMPFTSILHACFPMGSMTGAPKKKVMELIAKYENTARGLFSGSIGYITPGGDFDFNVVIRSIFYDEKMQIINFFAGSGITIYAEPDAEYDECMAKAEAMIKVLS